MKTTQPCPNRTGHGIQAGCITCGGTGEFSLPGGAWTILGMILAEQDLNRGERNVAAILAVRGLCRVARDDSYEATKAGVTAYEEHLQARGT